MGWALIWTLAATGMLAPGAAAPAGGHWPQWRGPERDGLSAETGLLREWPPGGPRRVLTATGLGRGYSSVAITGGRIYTMGDLADGQYVIALEESTGKRLWAPRVAGRNRRSDGFDGPRGTPTVNGTLLYALASDGTLVCLESATGAERWRRHLERDLDGEMMSGWQWSESPLVDGERVVVTPGGPRSGIVALDAQSGAEIWRAAIPRQGGNGSDGAGYSSIVVSHGGGVKQYVQLMGRGLVGVRASDGQFLWSNNSVANGTANISTPVVRGNFVFASTAYGTGSVLVELAPAGAGRVRATERYFLEGFESHHGGVVIVGDHVYGGHGSSNGFPTCIELGTGRLVWPRTRSSVGSGSAAVIAADGRLYFRYQNGRVVLIEASPSGYREAGSLAIPNPDDYSWPHPVIAGGLLYLREQDALHVYDVRR
jgi:outer membrane protein assembly factor BamB